MRAEDGSAVLQSIEVDSLGRRETSLGCQTERLVNHRFAADPYEDGLAELPQGVHQPKTFIIFLHTADKPETGVHDEVNAFHLLPGRQRQVSAQRPYIRHSVGPHCLVHRFVPSGYVIDNHGSEGVDGSACYPGSEGVDGQPCLSRYAPDYGEGTRQTFPFRIAVHRFASRSGGAGTYIQYSRSRADGVFRPSGYRLFRLPS